ncbi:MAG TPA: archease, partial [Pirellulales bacterium]
MYEVFEHTADIGLRVRSSTLEELFCDAARALFSLIVGNVDAVRPTKKVRLVVSGKPGGVDYLLFDWLNELLFQFDS